MLPGDKHAQFIEHGWIDVRAFMPVLFIHKLTDSRYCGMTGNVELLQ
jgi:hypothetical protein